LLTSALSPIKITPSSLPEHVLKTQPVSTATLHFSLVARRQVPWYECFPIL
jgi:hypothetical protein